MSVAAAALIVLFSPLDPLLLRPDLVKCLNGQLPITASLSVGSDSVPV